MIKTNANIGETPETTQSLGKFLGVGLVILALWSFLTDKKPNKISIAGIKKRKSNRLFYMLDTDEGLKTIPKDQLDYVKLEFPNKVWAVWALRADQARQKIEEGRAEHYLTQKLTEQKKLDFAGHLLNCIGWQQVIDKKGKQITRCFIMAPNCKTKACIKETTERKSEGWKPKGRKARVLQGVNLSCKQYVRDAFNKLRCKKFAITCNSENECGPKATIPWKPVDIEYTPKAIRAVAKMLANEMNQSIDDTKRVMRRIKYHGGIAPYSGGYLQEEYRSIPSKYKSKEGIKLDELAQEMEMDESELVEAIGKAEEARSRLPRKKSRFAVKDLMFDAESYLAKQEGGLQGIKSNIDIMKNQLMDAPESEIIDLMQTWKARRNEVIKKLNTYRGYYDLFMSNKITAEFIRHDLKIGGPGELKKQIIQLENDPAFEMFAMLDDAKRDRESFKEYEAKKAEKKIAEKGGQMTLFGKLIAKKIALRRTA